MKTPLKTFALFTTLAAPGALALEFAGINLPPSLDVGSAFGAFVVSLVALIAISDYARICQPRRVEINAASKAV